MSNSIINKLATVRRRAQRYYFWHALCWLVGTILVVAGVLSTVDYLFRIQDRGIRIIVSLLLAAATAWASFRFVARGLLVKLSDLKLARLVEEQFPQLKNRLASAVQFLQSNEDDPVAGSVSLRKAVISDAVQRAEPLPFEKVLDARPIRKAALAFLGVALVFLLIGLTQPELMQAGAKRLLRPWGDDLWPQTSHLALRDPISRIPRGETFHVDVIDAQGADLPDEVRFHYRYEGEDGEEVVEVMRRVSDAWSMRMENVSRPMWYRAEGGDDRSMDWTRLEVVEPPAVTDVAVEVEYPAYTGWGKRDGEKHLRVLAGTVIHLHAHATKPLISGAVLSDGEEPIPATLDEDGLGFHISANQEHPFIAKRSGSYWYQLLDTEEISGGNDIRYEMVTVPDDKPSLQFNDPATNLFVTATATVPLRFTASDDLAVKDVHLHFSRSDRSQEPEAVVPLRVGTPQPRVTEPMTEEPEVVEIRHDWNLAPLELAPGSQITVYGIASDYLDQTTESTPRRLNLITPEELQDRLVEQQGVIVSEIGRMAKLQQEARQQVQEAKVQMETVGGLTQSDQDRLHAAEFAQRQIDRGLTSDRDGIPGQISSILETLKINKVDNADIQRRMENILKELGKLGKENLPAIDRDMTQALKAADVPRPKDLKPEEPAPNQDKEAILTALDNVGQQQDQVSNSLENLLRDLSQWDNYRRFQRDVNQLRRDQSALQEETKSLGQQTLAKSLNDLPGQQVADLKKLSARQSDLGRRFDRLVQRMEQAKQPLQAEDPLAAQTIDDAIAQGQDGSVSGSMQEAAGNLEQNQVSQATENQDRIMQNLQEMSDTLSNRREQELTRLVKKLKAAEQELEQLRKQQEGLKKKFKDAEKIADPEARRKELERLTKQQRDLRQKVERFARQLQRLQADRAARRAAQAGQRMERAGQQGEQGGAEAAGDEAEQAQADLDQAQQELEQTRKEAEVDLASELIDKLTDSLKLLRDSQARILEETTHFDQAKRESPTGLSRAQSQSVGNLARDQRGLAEDCRGAAVKLESAKVFVMALTNIAEEMDSAATGLENEETGEETQSVEQQALTHLEQLMTALEEGKNQAQNNQQQQDGDQQEQEEGQQGAGPEMIRYLAELKLIRIIQTDVNTRTAKLDQEAAAGTGLTPEQQKEYEQLSTLQGKLADLLLDMGPAPEENQDDPLQELFPDDNKEKSPDDGPLDGGNLPDREQ